MHKPECGSCGNDGTESSLFLTIDAKWHPETKTWELEEREDDGGMELDCLACDERTPVCEGAGDVPEPIFPYGFMVPFDGAQPKVPVLNADTLFDVLTSAKIAAEQDDDDTSASEIYMALEAINPFAAGYIATALADHFNR